MSTHSRHGNHRQSGLGLVEIMVAIVVGLIVLDGVLQIYLNSNQTYRMQENQSRIQENGRFALQFMTKDLRTAGYIGCVTLPQISINVLASGPPLTPMFDPATVIQGYDSGAWPATFPAQPANLVLGTSVLVVTAPVGDSVQLNADLPNPTADIGIASNPYNFKTGDLLLVSDCQSAHLFKATGVTASSISHATTGNSSAELSKDSFKATYKSDALVMKYDVFMYYIGTYADPSTGANKRALFRWSPAGANQLIDNVQDMQITYGIDTLHKFDDPGVVNFNAYQYLAAAAVTAANRWPDVVSTQVNLLLVSNDDGLTTQPQQYSFNGAAVTATDRRLYRLFSGTIAFRNRVK